MAYQAGGGSLQDMDSSDQDWDAATGSPRPVNTPSGPDEQDWNRLKPRIHQLYVVQDRTCSQVREILGREGFHASERMYKGRFRSWKMDTKTIKDIEYEAMDMIYATRHLAGEEVEFTVAHGGGPERKTVTIAEIKKHLARAANSQQKRQRLSHRATLDEEGYPYHMTRARKEIEFHVVSFRSTSDSSSSEQSISPSPGVDTQMQLSSAAHELQGFSTGDSPMQAPFATTTQTRYPGRSILPTTSRSLSLLTDLDLSDFFERMELSSRSDEPNTVSDDTDTGKAKQWAFHVFMVDIRTDRNLDGSGWHREKARQCFEQMLVGANKHLLTSLFQISAVLGSLGRYSAYRNFLIDCCKVMDDLKVPLDRMTPYRYALACESGNQAGIKLYSEKLEASTKHCQEFFGVDSANILASMHFQASHVLDQVHDVPEAIKLLEVCLIQSDNILHSNHLINVNCLTLLARAYSTQGHPLAAINLYEDAVRRCMNNRSIGRKHPYRLRYLRDLAVLQTEVGDFVNAERNLMEVLSGRRETLGPGHGDTWGALEDLKSLFGLQNRECEWQRLVHELRQAHWANQGFVSPREAYMP